MKPIMVAAIAALISSGCTLDPVYQRPALPTAARYPDSEPAYKADRAHRPAAESAVPAEQTGWRQVFTDPHLQALISLALDNSRNLRIAILNVAAAQAQFRAERANLFPTLDATAEATIEGNPTIQAEPALQTSTGHATTQLYSAGLGFTAFELDLFGHIRSQTESQFQIYLGQAETRRSTQISLVAQVANDYITLLADRQQLSIARQTLDAQVKSYSITKAMFDQGTTTFLSLRQAETTVDTAQASVAQFTRQVAQDVNALTQVVGTPIPEELLSGSQLTTETIMSDLPAGLPSALLTRRPDVMAAEHTLLSANALIGVARAAFFPSITLTASGGVASSLLNKLVTPAAQTWTFEPTITLPIFTWGQNQANLDYANVQKRIEIATYEQTIQTAFREVADGLAARGTFIDQIQAQQKLVDANADAYRLADRRFRVGADNYLATLTSQQSLFSSEQSLITLKELELQNLATLYKALGGGWFENTRNDKVPHDTDHPLALSD